MGGMTGGFPVVSERPNHGSEQLKIEDLEPGMMVELVERDDEGRETTSQLGVLAVGQKYEYPEHLEGRPRRQLFGRPELDIVDDAGRVIMLENAGELMRDEELGLAPAAYSTYELGLGELERDEGQSQGGWHPDNYLRRSPEPTESYPSLQEAILGMVTTTEPTITPVVRPEA